MKHRNRRFVVIFISSLFGILCFLVWNSLSNSTAPPAASLGRLHLSETQLHQAATPLDGEWRFVWGELHDPGSFPADHDVLMTLPRTWNGFTYRDTSLPSHGYGTFQLDVVVDGQSDYRELAVYIPFIHSSYSLFLGEELIAKDGEVARDGQSFVPSAKTQMVPFRTTQDTLRLTLQVANFAYALGGVWQSPRIGSRVIIQNHHDKQLAFDQFIIGGLIIMGVYHIALFMMRSKIKSNLFFGLLCLMLAVKNLFTGAAFFFTLWPLSSYELGLKLIHITIFAAIPLLWLFLRELFPPDFPSWVVRSLLVICGLGILLTLVLSSAQYSELMLPFWAITGITIIMMVRGIYRSVRTRKEGALVILAGVACFIFTVLHDLAIDFKLIQSVYLTGAGFFIFIFSQSVLLAMKFTLSFQKVEKLTTDLLDTNISFSRFVPSEYLSFLQRESILDVKLGDSAQREMTVFFSDIRSYTSLSEEMSPKTNFAFINDYLGKAVRYIHANGGMVNQYLGDGILALFANDPKKAIQSAVEIQKGISGIRNLGGFLLDNALETGIGIHTGTVILGMMGTAQRMAPGVISDTVNTASRLEGLTKFFGAQIIVSEPVLDRMQDTSEFSFRFLGKVTVKGRKNSLKIYEILDGLPEEIRELKLASRNYFESGLESYFSKDFVHAIVCFNAVLELNPKDLAAQLYLRNSEEYLKEGVLEHWEGALKMEFK